MSKNHSLRNFRFFALAIFMVFVHEYSFAQMDSLKRLLKTNLHDSVRVEVLFAMCDLEQDNRVWPKYNEEVFKIIKKHSKTKNAKEQRQYAIYRGHYYLNKGYLYNQMGNLVAGLKYYKSGLLIFEKMNDKAGMGIALNNVGYVLQNMGEFDSALKYYVRGYELKKTLNDTLEMGISLGNIASTYEFLKQPQKAVSIYWEAIRLHSAVGNTRVKAISMSNLATLYLALNKPDSAMLLIEQSLEIRRQLGNADDIALSHLILAGWYRETGNEQKAFEVAKQAYGYAQKNKTPEVIKRCAEVLYRISENRGDRANAFTYFKEYISIRDTIFNQRAHAETVKQQLQYEFGKQQIADSIARAKEKELHALQLKQEQTQRFALYGGLALVMLFAVVVFNRFRKTKKQNRIIEEQKHIVEEKQKEILDSIHYARRIQRSLLPNEKTIKGHLGRLGKNGK